MSDASIQQPDEREGLVDLTRQLLAAVEPSDALRVLQRARRSGLSERDLCELRTAVWRRLAQSDGLSPLAYAAEILADAERLHELDPERGAAAAIALYDADAYDEAIELFQRLVDAGEDYESWLLAALVEAGRTQEAIERYESRHADPDDWHARYWTAKAMSSEQRFREALELLRHPKTDADATALSLRSTCLAELGDVERAARVLDAAIELKPGSAGLRHKRARLKAELADDDGATADWADAVVRSRDVAPGEREMTRRKLLHLRLREHFDGQDLDRLEVSERTFPSRVRPDIQQALDSIADTGAEVLDFCGITSAYSGHDTDLPRLFQRSQHVPATAGPPRYEDVDIGEERPVRCLVSGLWLLEHDGARFAMLLATRQQHGPRGHHFQIAVPPGRADLAERIFLSLEDAVEQARSYRGKVLSLEICGSQYTGRSTGLRVLQPAPVSRDQLVLPEATLQLLERNVIGFTRRRERLRELGLPTKKGLLFHGPPGTGKTHTIQYLAAALTGQTTLVITAEQIGLLSEYMILARMLQPALVVIEDVDLVARERSAHSTPGGEALLNRLLNEMDGLQRNSDVLFVLTTNRPSVLEPALAARPGRIDQAIEFPLPDLEGRRRLAKLYSAGLELDSALVELIAERTDGTSASFVKELMRRSAQFMLERDAESAALTQSDVEAAIHELVIAGGALNQTLLGGANAPDA